MLGPDTVARITEESAVAERPALATLSAIVHSESQDIAAILELLARGMRTFDKATATYWAELLEVGLENTPAQETWRELQSMVGTFFPGRGTLIEETWLAGQASGEAKGEAKGILRILEVRGLPVSDDMREYITTCTDLDRLDDWLDRAGTVERAEELRDEVERAEGSREEPGRG